MLVLSRHRNQQIVIGEEIVITVVDIRGDKIRLGIEAPPHVSVHRLEVYEALQRHESQTAAKEKTPSEAAAEENPGSI